MGQAADEQQITYREPQLASDGEPGPFSSILFDRPENGGASAQEPAFFGDLNLDQVLESITAGRGAYDLAPFFNAPLHDVAAVEYRHEVLRDLETPAVLECINAFAGRMRVMREHLAQVEALHYAYQKERWFVDAAAVYSNAVASLTESLTALPVRSRGFRALRDHLSDYTESASFTALVSDTQAVKDSLAAVRYCVNIKGKRVRVTKYEDEPDYSEAVERTFAKFKRGAVKDYRVKLFNRADMDHVEARVLDLVARLFPDAFRGLDEYCARHRDYLDATIRTFDREVQFYVAYLEYVERLREAGLAFCYPRVSDRSREIRVRDAFDVALAGRLVAEGSTVVCNDFYLTEPERIFVVTGPNQGGKTTFARMVGQLHYLASLGYLVPAEEAALFLPDRVFTHFEREEELATLRGKLEDELVRVHELLGQATSESLIVMNESFTSTTLNDALVLGGTVMRQIAELGALCVYVTFVDELTSLNERTVSMVSAVVPDDPATRTFKIDRRPADGLAYAAAIAEKYGLTYQRLRRRIAR